MNSVEAFTLLSKVINGNGDEKSIEYVNDHYYAITFKILNDLEIVECFKKIPKQDLKDFIDWQIRYEKNMNTWLEGCNADLAKEEPTKHLIKIKEWLENGND